MKTYTAEQMGAIRSLADLQMEDGINRIHVIDEERNIDINSPWYEETGRWEFNTDSEAIEYWGEDLFEDFCDKALAYLGDDTAQKG